MGEKLDSGFGEVPLRRGVPTISEGVVPVPRMTDALERGLARGVPIVVQGPTGSGKTTAIAAWLRSRNDLDAVWITVSAQSWLDVRRTVEAELGIPSDGAGRRPGGWGGVARHVRAAPRRLVVVVDGAERMMPALRLDRIVAALEQLPRLTVVLTSRAPLVDDRTPGSSRVAIVGPELAWDHATSRDAVAALGIDVPAIVLEAIRTHAVGRAEAILECAVLWHRERTTLPVQRRRRVERLVASWLVSSAEQTLSATAARLVLLVASLGEVPADLADRLGIVLPGHSPADMGLLVEHGFLVEHVSPFSSRPVYAAPPAVASKLRLLAAETEGELCRAGHELALTLESTSPLHAYHRARSGDEEVAAAMILDRWRSRDRDPGARELFASVLSLDPGVIAREPVLAALRMVADRQAPRVGRPSSTPYRDVLLALGPDDLRALDLADRLLVEGAIVDVHLNRNQPWLAVRRSSALAEQHAAERSRLSSRERRALAHLLVGVAEAQLATLRPEQAMTHVGPVLELEASDRWVITAYRASAIAALCACFNGERDWMRELILEANVYAGFGEIEAGPVHGTQWLAEVVDALHRGHVEEAETIALRFEAFGRGSIAGEMTSEVLLAAVQAHRGELPAASGRLTRILASPKFPSQNPLTRALAVAIAAETYLAEGRPGAVLGLLETHTSIATHALCFDPYRAAAHLALGRPSLALMDTRECVRPSLRHATASLARVAVVRAAAHLELRHPEAARREILRALHLTPPEWRPATLAILPGTSLAGLRALLEGWVATEVLAELDEIAADASRRTRAFPEPLSHREVRLLALLSSDDSFADIARRLYVSINTVKSQARSLYRKLGVTSRVEAVDLAYAMGFDGRAAVNDASRRRA